MSAPALIYLACLFIATGIALSNHGTPRRGNYSFWLSMVGNSAVVGLLYWGGFFAKVPA